MTSTPSATLHQVSRDRVATAPPIFSSLVAVADPTGDLAFARTEVAQISGRFAKTRTAIGREATGEWLRGHAAEGAVLHLACHAYGGMLDPYRSGFVLSDGPLAGAEVAALDLRSVRLAVASACQTGVVGIGDQADEAASLASALLAAGAACCIASLWRVDDLATAMLMTRLYEEITRGNDPPSALAAAQRWLRSLADADRRDYLLRHPTLARSWAIAVQGGAPVDPTGRPFAHPRYWAAFVALGA